MKRLDCAHDLDRCISSKKNRMEKNKKVDDICCFVIIKTILKKLGGNTASLFCS